MSYGGVLFCSKKGADLMVNGLERDDLLKRAQIECSDSLHEDGDDADKEDQIFTLHMKDK